MDLNAQVLGELPSAHFYYYNFRVNKVDRHMGVQGTRNNLQFDNLSPSIEVVRFRVTGRHTLGDNTTWQHVDTHCRGWPLPQ